MKLLVVNENSDFSALVADYAEGYGIAETSEVRTVESGHEALATFSSWLPSLVIVDAHLSDMNALELIDQVQSVHTPVVLTSNTYSRDIESTAEKYGAAGYIVASRDHDVLEKLFGLIEELGPSQGSLH